MNTIRRAVFASAVASAIALTGCASMSPQNSAGFFVTSTGSGKGADFGGLAGADKHCTALAAAAGLPDRTWHAYLSTQASGSTPAVNAKDRIGSGPWMNVKGVVIAKDVAELHGTNNLNKATALTEKGDVVPASGDTPNKHDILTGSQPDGTAYPAGDDKTCGNWTKSGDGSAIVGHHNRNGTSPPPSNTSWNSSHPTKGCSDPGLASTGGAGLFYCFATK
ncbi:MAG: hypothetical protein ABI607_09205 [Betaproteobacteria bacterium]